MTKRTHIRIGRLATNQVVINDPAIGDVHLELFADGEGNVFITDMGAAQGTSINGKRLKGYAQLMKGDDVILGGKFRFNWEKYRIKNNPTSTTDKDNPVPKPQDKKNLDPQVNPKEKPREKVKVVPKDPLNVPSKEKNLRVRPAKIRVSWLLLGLVYLAIFTFLYLIYRIN